MKFYIRLRLVKVIRMISIFIFVGVSFLFLYFLFSEDFIKALPFLIFLVYLFVLNIFYLSRFKSISFDRENIYIEGTEIKIPIETVFSIKKSQIIYYLVGNSKKKKKIRIDYYSSTKQYHTLLDFFENYHL